MSQSTTLSRRHVAVSILAVTTSLLLACLLGCRWLVFGCIWWDCSSGPLSSPDEFQIPSEYFPQTPTNNRLSPAHDTEGANEKWSQTIFWGENNGQTSAYSIARYPSSLRAQVKFSEHLGVYSDGPGEPWKKPDGLDFESLAADEFFLGCGQPEEPLCGYMARYGWYLITFTSRIDELMTLEKYLLIVEYIDTNVAARMLQLP